MTAVYNKDKKLTPFEINFYFAFLALPIMVAFNCYTGAISQLARALEEKNVVCLTYLFASGCGGILITNFAILTVSLCGPIAFNIAGNSKDIVLTFVGFALFDDVKPTPMNITGLTLSFIGAIHYTYDKVMTTLAEQEK